LTWLISIIALGILVLVHETGHFLMARRLKVGVEKFSIGFGKPLLRFVRKGVEYRLGWLFLGGYVKMKGEHPDDPAADAEDSFITRPWWKKALIAFAGPMANLIFGMLLFIGSFTLPIRYEDHQPVVDHVSPYMAEYFIAGDTIRTVNGQEIKGWYQFLSGIETGKDNILEISRMGSSVKLLLRASEVDSLYPGLQPRIPPVIGEVIPGLPAWQRKLRRGDLVLAVDSVRVADWYGMRELIVNAPGSSVCLDIQRGDSTFQTEVALDTNLMTGAAKAIGISHYMPVDYVHRYSPAEAAKYGFRTTVSFVVSNYQGLSRVFTTPSQLKSNLGGPVMIMSMSSQAVQRGFNSTVAFFAALSLLLMIVNLLPIPVLDGGHILFSIIEGIRGKPLSKGIQVILQKIGLLILLSLMVFVFHNDLTRVFSRAMSP